jgi:hypothetical protein
MADHTTIDTSHRRRSTSRSSSTFPKKPLGGDPRLVHRGSKRTTRQQATRAAIGTLRRTEDMLLGQEGRLRDYFLLNVAG